MCTVDHFIFKKPHMSVMRLATTMHNKSWDNVMSPAQMSSYKMERPAYSTPPPVENIPTNNECTMVELRGTKVASFSLGCEEYICLPQAFDLFLKHLVGGLHTVYTKLKRLNITPVVCNVEQVRVLRGLGAIQPGVNRCKLITRKDFEVLYQDCTTASRPGRPPKRYPVLPPTTDLMSHHANLRSGNTLLNQTDFSVLQKRIRLGSSMEQTNERRASGSPTKENEKAQPSLPLLATDLHSNPNANLAYLQQAIRQQYQQAAASGLHSGLDAQQINPALAPFMMMSHPALFSSGIPPTSIAVLNHINQMAQNHAASGAMTSAAAAAAAQLAASGGSLSQLTAQSSNQTGGSPSNEKDSDAEDRHTPRYENALGLTNGIGSDGRTSPASSLGSMHEGAMGHMSDGSSHTHQNFNHSFKEQSASKLSGGDVPDAVRELAKPPKIAPSSDDEMKSTESNISSMQTLLTNIQGLLKVAADNASLQEKHASIEIAELKLKLNQEKQLRKLVEQKLNDCDKEKAEAERRYNKERKENKKLQGQIVSMQRILGHDVNNNNSNDGDVEVTSPQPSSPASNGVNAGDVPSETSSPAAMVTSPETSFPPTSSFDPNAFAARIAASQQAGSKSSSRSSPSPTSLSITSLATNTNNNNNNHNSDDQKSPDFSRRQLISDSRVADIAIDLGMSRAEHPVLQDQRIFIKNSPLLFQQTTSQ